MPLYQYKALDSNGKTIKGTINAESEKGARTKIRADGAIPLELDAISQELLKTEKKQKNIDKKIQGSDLSLFTRELSSLVGAGLEIEQSLQSIAEQTENKKLKPILGAIHTRILEGHSFSSGLSEFPKAFPKLYTATIRSGEEAGHLGDVLNHLAEYLDRQAEMHQKIVQALVYPGILTLTSISIVAFLLVYVTPKIIAIFSDANQALPLATQILILISSFLTHYGFILLIVLIVLSILWKRLMKTEAFKEGYDRFLLKIPLIGKMITLIETARFLRTLAILTEATVPILSSFLVASELIHSTPIRKAVLVAKDQIKEGSTIHFALKRARYFNASSIQFIASGENSGKLEEMLMRSALNQERHVEFTLGSLLSAFEPLLIVVMGAIVLFIILATLLPIFQLSNMMG